MKKFNLIVMTKKTTKVYSLGTVDTVNRKLHLLQRGAALYGEVVAVQVYDNETHESHAFGIEGEDSTGFTVSRGVVYFG